MKTKFGCDWWRWFRERLRSIVKITWGSTCYCFSTACKIRSSPSVCKASVSSWSRRFLTHFMSTTARIILEIINPYAIDSIEQPAWTLHHIEDLTNFATNTTQKNFISMIKKWTLWWLVQAMAVGQRGEAGDMGSVQSTLREHEIRLNSLEQELKKLQQDVKATDVSAEVLQLRREVRNLQRQNCNSPWW